MESRSTGGVCALLRTFFFLGLSVLAREADVHHMIGQSFTEFFNDLGFILCDSNTNIKNKITQIEEKKNYMFFHDVGLRVAPC